MGFLDMTDRRATKISVIVLGGALFAILMAYMVFGDNNDEQGLKTLRMISILFRHGDKNPSGFYPSDPHATRNWKGGLGALTQKGTLQSYNLGKNLKMRYYRLLPPSGIYSQNDILVLSSAAERCIMSAQGVLAGFMPPLEQNNVLPILWQPVAVNILPRSEDTILAQKKPCSKYDEVLSKFYKSPTKNIQKLNEDNADLYKLLTKHTRRNISNILDVEMLYTTLDIEEKADLTLPDWTENIFPEKLLPLAERSYTLFTETSLMKKVKGGAFLTEVLNKMEAKKLHENPDRKIFLYSGHDVSLVNVMNSMGILDQTANIPEHSSALVFELHHSSLYRDDFEVKIVYFFNSDDKFPKELDIPNCDSPCSLKNFRKSFEHLIMTNYDETCENVSNCKS